jgi:hypothetical protein
MLATVNRADPPVTVSHIVNCIPHTAGGRAGGGVLP